MLRNYINATENKPNQHCRLLHFFKMAFFIELVSCLLMCAYFPRVSATFDFSMYSEPNLQGEWLDFPLEAQCTDIIPSFDDLTVSINMRGGCGYLCKDKECQGECLKMEPGVEGSDDLRRLGFANSISSVKNCDTPLPPTRGSCPVPEPAPICPPIPPPVQCPVPLPLPPACPEQQKTLATIHTDTNFGGLALDITLSGTDCFTLTGDWKAYNKAVSSIETYGTCIAVYADSNCGTGYLATHRYADMNGVASGFNDQMSSLRACTADELQTGFVTLYEDVNYGGKSFSVRLVKNQCVNLNDFNDITSSLHRNDVNVCLYPDFDCKGNGFVFREGDANVGDLTKVPFNDVTSSARQC